MTTEERNRLMREIAERIVREAETRPVDPYRLEWAQWVLRHAR